MAHKAYQGPAGALTELVGYLGGTTRVTALHQTLVQDSIDVRAVSSGSNRLDQSGWAEGGGLFCMVTTVDQARGTACRFTCDIPQGATILSATFYGYARDNQTWNPATGTMDVGAEQADDATAVTSGDRDAKFANQGTLSTWAPDGSITNGNPLLPASDVTAVVQQIVDRAGWAPGNHIQLLTEHPGGADHTGSYRGHDDATMSLRPRLEVEFEYLA